MLRVEIVDLPLAPKEQAEELERLARVYNISGWNDTGIQVVPFVAGTGYVTTSYRAVIFYHVRAAGEIGFGG
jgi:hypothetical protein